MARSRFLSVRVVELLAVAVIGGALALGGAAALGKLGDKTTVQQVTTTAAGIPTTSQSSTSAKTALTAEQIYRRDAPGVVQITATSVSQASTDPFNLLPTTPQTSQSLGSGFVIDKAGHIVTNYHVIQGAKKVQVSFSGQDELTATVVGKDPSTDVAILKIDAHARALTPLELGNSDAVVVGDSVDAIGNPFGFTRTLTTGVVSAVQRQIEAPNSLPIDHAIQTDAAINHGNSGGPLIDAQRPGDRHQLPDRHRFDGPAGQRRHRLRDPDQHGPERRCADHLERQGHPGRHRQPCAVACGQRSDQRGPGSRLPRRHPAPDRHDPGVAADPG